jgi:SSS family solute:Na+ symporter
LGDHGLQVQIVDYYDGAYAPVLKFFRWIQVVVTGQLLTFWAVVSSIGLYILISLFGPRHEHDLDALLHRGEHAPEGEGAACALPSTWLNKLGFDAQMTRWDRIVTVVTLAWPVFFTLVFAGGLIAYAMGASLSDATWASLWHVYLWVVLIVGGIVTVWFTIGGMRDLVRLYRRLRSAQPDAADDGSVH